MNTHYLCLQFSQNWIFRSLKEIWWKTPQTTHRTWKWELIFSIKRLNNIVWFEDIDWIIKYYIVLYTLRASMVVGWFLQFFFAKVLNNKMRFWGLVCLKTQYKILILLKSRLPHNHEKTETSANRSCFLSEYGCKCCEAENHKTQNTPHSSKAEKQHKGCLCSREGRWWGEGLWGTLPPEVPSPPARPFQLLLALLHVPHSPVIPL